MGIKELQEFLDSVYDREYIQRVKFKIAWGYFMDLKYKKALQAFNDVIDLHPESELAYQSRYWRGIIFFKEKKYQNSNDELKMIVSHDSKKDFLNDILWRIGDNYLLSDEPEKAIEIFKKLQKRFPDERYYAIDERLMKAYIKVSNYKEYLDTFSRSREVFSLKNEFIKDAFRLGNELLNYGNFLEARKIFKETGTELFVKKEVVQKSLFMIGESYYAEGRIGEAMKYFKILLKRGVNHDTQSRVYFRMANIFASKGDMKEAVKAYERGFYSAENEKVKALLLYGVGEGYLKLNHLENALDAFERIIKDFPREKSLIKEKMNIGLVFQKNKKNDLAIEAFRQVAEQSQNPSLKAEAQFWIGETLELQGKDQEAIKEYLKAAYSYKHEGMWGVTARFKAGEIYEKLESYREAIVLYKDIAEKFKGKEQGAIASQKIEHIKKLIKR
jgi:TolA-binding protein